MSGIKTLEELMAINRVKTLDDKDWVRSIFMINASKLDGISESERTWSSADLKFQDTALGGSLVINPLPQPSIFTDPLNPNHWLNEFKASDGLSPYFSEAFDDNYRFVTVRFGTLAFTSVIGFLMNMYHPGAAAMVNKGRVHSLMFTMGRLVGAAVSLLTWPIGALTVGAQGLRWLMKKPFSKYAYLKPNMPLYWSRVQTIVNHFMTDLGLVHRVFEGSDDETYGNVNATSAQIEHMKNMWPNIYGFNSSSISQSLVTASLGGAQGQMQIDAFVVATRAQRLAFARQKALEVIDDKVKGAIDVRKIFIESYRQKRSEASQSISEYFNTWMETAGQLYNLEGIDGAVAEGTAEAVDTADSPSKSQIDNEGVFAFFAAEARDGGAFISFRVDENSSVSETFTNNYRTSALMEKINGISAQARSTYFDMAGGNIGDGLLSDTIETVASMSKGLLEGFATGLGIEGLMVAGGGGTVSMPKYWDTSEVALPKANYTCTLKARYANRRAAFQDIYFPLACFLAGAMPGSVGRHSHSNPFYLEYYDKGRMQTRLGAIDSLTVTRGDGNMGFTPDGHMMSCTISFSIAPMEEMVAAPVTEGYNMSETFESVAIGATAGGLVAGVGGAIAGALGGAAVSIMSQLTRGMFDDDTPFMDYMATLAGLGVNEQIYLISKLKRRLTLNRQNFISAWSPAKRAAYMADNPVGYLATIAFSELGFVLDGQQRHLTDNTASFYDERASQ